MNLKKITPRKAPKVGTSFIGEFVSTSGDHLGMLHKVEGGYRVLAVECGMVYAESEVLPRDSICRAGGLDLSASRSVNFYCMAA